MPQTALHLLAALGLLGLACSPEVESSRPHRRGEETIAFSMSGCPSVNASQVSRPQGRSVSGDVEGDGRPDRVYVVVDRTEEPGCRALLVVRGRSSLAAVGVDEGVTSFELGLPRLNSLVDIDSEEGLEIVLDVAQGASTAFVGVFSMTTGTLEGVRPPRLPDIPSGLFAYGGSVGHLDAVDCRGDLVMVSRAVSQGRGYVITRRFLEPQAAEWRLRGSLTEKRSVRPQGIARFEEFSAPPFSSC
jgi:hypothetical protein